MKASNLQQPQEVNLFKVEINSSMEIPLVSSTISAGFPSPADDFLDKGIDLHKEYIKHPASTFYARVKGNSMKDLGIHNGDLMIIDKSLKPKNGAVAVCYVDGSFTVKTIKIEADCCWLIPANEKYKPLKVTKDNDFIIWGIVTNVIKSF